MIDVVSKSVRSLMLRVCGLTISGSTAFFAIVTPDGQGGIAYHQCATKKLALEDEKSSESLKGFLRAIGSFSHENNVEAFAIKQRQSKGQMASGGITFKIETLFQLVEGPETFFVHPGPLASFSKTNIAGLPQGMQGYLNDAFRCGAYQLNKLGLL